MTIGVAVQAMLVGMPAPRDLHRVEVDGQVLICVGATVMFSYDAGFLAASLGRRRCGKMGVRPSGTPIPL
jgi:hypothetical protein